MNLPTSLVDLLAEIFCSNAAPLTTADWRRLADHNSARGLGLAYPTSQLNRLGPHAWNGPAPTTGLPWDDGAAFLQRFATGQDTLALENEAGSWLLGLVPNGPAVVWVLDTAGRNWTETEREDLRLTARFLARTPTEPQRIARRLELAAHVAARLSHDFGNVLTSVMGFTELAQVQGPRDPLTRQYLDEVWGVASGGADWLKRLNLFCRRGEQPSFAPAPLRETVSSEAERVRQHGQDRLNLMMDVPAGLPPLACEANALREAVGQLLNNACEALGTTGTVTLSARVLDLDEADCRQLLGAARPGCFVEIAVADTGCGLSPATCERVFSDLFFSTKPRHRGLGLPSVVGIAQRFGGGLHLSLRAEGGTLARLFFPVASAATERPTVP